MASPSYVTCAVLCSVGAGCDVNGNRSGLIRYGFQFPEDGVEIIVERKPTEQFFWTIPDLPASEPKQTGIHHSSTGTVPELASKSMCALIHARDVHHSLLIEKIEPRWCCIDRLNVASLVTYPSCR